MTGHRKYLLAAIQVLAGATLVTLAINLISDHFTSEPFAPLYGTGYTEPQLAEDYVKAGEALTSSATKCSSMDGIGVSGSVTLRKMTAPDGSNPVELFAGSRILNKGCTTNTYRTLIPATTLPGRYELVGAEQASDGKGRSQLIIWHSEPFEVTAR